MALEPAPELVQAHIDFAAAIHGMTWMRSGR